MKKIKKTVAMVLTLGVLASGVGTGSEISAKVNVKKPSIAKSATVMENQQKSLSIKMSGYKVKSIIAKSSNKSVVKVRANKKTKTVIVTGKSAGTAKVTTSVRVIKNKKIVRFKLTTSVTVSGFVMPGFENFDHDYAADIESTGADVLFKTTTGILGSLIPSPWGGGVKEGLNALWGGMMSGDSDNSSFAAISGQLDNLRDQIEGGFNDVKQQITDSVDTLEKHITNQAILTEKGQSFDDMYNLLKAKASDIETIMSTDLPAEIKAIDIAAYIGPFGDWRNSNNFLCQCEKLMSTLSSPATFIDPGEKRDYFHVVADSYINKMKKDILFSGEAVKKSEPFVSEVYSLALFAYTIVSQCLKAHQLINSIKIEKKDKTDTEAATGTAVGTDTVKNIYDIIDSIDESKRGLYDTYDEKLKNTREGTQLEFISKEINTIHGMMFDDKEPTSVAAHLNTFMNSYRTTYVLPGYGYNEIEFDKKLKTYELRDGKSWNGSVEFGSMEDACWDLTWKAGFNFRQDKEKKWIIGEMDTITEYAYKKNLTLRDYLTDVGFDLSDLDDDTLFLRRFGQVYENYVICGNYPNGLYGYYESWEDDYVKMGYEYEHALYYGTYHPYKICLFRKV